MFDKHIIKQFKKKEKDTQPMQTNKETNKYH